MIWTGFKKYAMFTMVVKYLLLFERVTRQILRLLCLCVYLVVWMLECLNVPMLNWLGFLWKAMSPLYSRGSR